MASLVHRFYNARTPIHEAIPYDKTNPLEERERVNALWQLNVKEKSFFEVPVMLDVPGQGAVLTHFDKTIRRKYAQQGLIQIDAEMDDGAHTDFAKNDADAKRKAEDRYEAYCMDIAQRHINEVIRRRAENQPTEPARDFVKYCLKRFGLKDPAEDVKNIVERTREEGEIAELRKQNADLAAQMQLLMSMFTPAAAK